MLIIEENLNQLSRHHSICERNLVETFCLKIKLGKDYFEPKKNYDNPIVYGHRPDPAEIFSTKKSIEQNLTLEAGARIIGCSADLYRIPLDHFGLVQTKGTLARLFVQATCGDGQVEPGFNGYITLEIVNMSPWTIQIPKDSEVAQMYIFKASTEARNGYNGRYSKLALSGPTIPIFDR